MTLNVRAGLLGPVLLLLVACSEAPKQPAAKKAEPPDAPLTGREAFQRMFPEARAWALDASPLQLQSYNLSMVKSANGKAGAWQATFVSVAQGKARTYSWSAVEAEGNLHKGVFAGPEQRWAGPTGTEMPFPVEAIRTDSDAAYETALKQKDTVAFITKFPGKPMGFLLERTKRFPDVTWRVFWGESIGTSEYSVFVDASTGAFLEKVL